jgi:hypothetical protein
VVGEQLGFGLGKLRELAFKGLSDASMKRTSRLAQQRAIRRILHQGMFEQIHRMGRDALPEQQAGLDEMVESRVEFPLRLAYHRSQQFMRKLSPYGSSDLAYFLGRRADPVEPRH